MTGRSAVALLPLLLAFRAEAYETAAGKGGGISGKVVLEGTAPSLPPLKVTKNKDQCGQTVPDPTWSVGAGGSLGNVLVSIPGIPRGKAAPTEAVTLTNQGCLFRPHLLAAAVGQPLKVTNADAHSHNTHLLQESNGASLGNFALPFQGFSLVKPVLKEPGAVRVKCDIHEWMHAWIWVVDDPYFTVTGEDGAFRIEEVPPGSYTVVAWHEVLGKQEIPVTVVAGKTAELEIRFKAR